MSSNRNSRKPSRRQRPAAFLRRFGSVALLLLALTAFHSTQNIRASDMKPEEPRLLTNGETITRSMNGAGRHSYKVLVEKGKCLRLEVMQKGIDVLITLKNEAGATMKKTDRPSGAYGRETVTYIAPSNDYLIVEVTAYVPDALDGGYDLKFVDLLEPTPSDLTRAKAEDVTSEAEELRAQPSQESRLKAVEMFKEALGLWESLGDKFEQGIAHYGIGFTLYNLSDNYPAAVSLQKALRLAREVQWNFGQAAMHTALGAVQYTMGQYDLSEFNHRRAIEIYTEIDNPRGLGVANHGLGTVRLLTGRYAEALETLETSRRWRERANDRSGLVLTGFSLVDLNLIRRDAGKAESELTRVESLLGPQKSAVNGQYFYFLGRVNHALGKYDAAVEAFTNALSIFDREGNRLRRAQTHFEMSRTRSAQGRLDEALTEITRATDAVERLRRETDNYRLRVGFSSLVEPFFGQQVDVLMALHAKQPDAGFDRRAFDASERARSRGLLDSLERRLLIRQSVIDPALLEEENVLRDRIGAILRDLSGSAGGNGFEAFQDVLADYADVEARINAQLTVPEKTTIATVSSDDLGKLLDADTVMLSYTSAGDRVYLWRVTRDGMTSYDLGSSDAVASAAKSAFTCFSVRPAANAKGACRTESSALGRMMLEPVAGGIKGKKLIVVRHGDLEGIPWGALRNPSNRRYLIETNEIVSLPSASVLGMLRRIGPVETKGAAVFADPVYSATDGRLKTKPGVQIPKPSVELPRLFASRFEAARIEALFPKGEVLTGIDFDASREGFVKMNLGGFRILHFAAHALVNDDEPDQSSVVLSLFADDGTPREGMIRTNDIQRRDLNAELVVLSACQTGVGKQIRGEGFASLAQAFFSAGARKVMFSGWQVDDKVTAETMSRFYRRHVREGLSPSSALRETQRSVLRDPRWSHPFYWAAFSLQGELR